MDWYQKLLRWFTTRPRWLQVVLIIALTLLVVLGFWLSDYKTGDSAASMVDSPTWILSVVWKFAIVLALIYGAAIIFKRWQTGNVKGSQRRMKIIETTPLSPKRALYLVELDGQTYMVGATDQSINLIAEVGSLEDHPAVPANNFADSLAIAEKNLEI